jgi:hypothetical protein
MSTSKQAPTKSVARAPARLHRKVWQLHDKEDFDSLQSTASQLYVVLGWQESVAAHASQLLASAYRLADVAETAKSRKEERAIYAQAAERLRALRELLGRRHLTGAVEVMWWKAFRRRQTSKELALLFGSLFLTTAKPIFAMRAAVYLRNAARLHSDRDWEAVDIWLERYWLAADKARRKPLVGGI